MSRGFFLTFEGVDGSGKSTQARLLYDYLLGKSYDVILTREPDGTDIGKKIRQIVLSPTTKNLDVLAELLLYSAARCQHVQEIILPALTVGKIVISDRFFDSTFVYQGWGRCVDKDLITKIYNLTLGEPNLTILLNLDVATSLSRNKLENKIDRIELETYDFHERVYKGYLELANCYPQRIVVIDASKDVDTIHREVVKVVESVLCKQKDFVA